MTLRVWFHGSTVSPEASAKVMESVNAYLQDKINVTLEPIWGTWGDFDTATVTALTGGDDVEAARPRTMTRASSIARIFFIAFSSKN